MNDPTPATVDVPVTLIHRAAVALAGQPDHGARKDLLALLPKPRLVAFDYGKWMEGSQSVEEYRDSQPDLLTLLDEVCDNVAERWSTGFNEQPATLSADLKDRIRMALGVDQ